MSAEPPLQQTTHHDAWQCAQRARDILRFAPIAPLSTAGGCCAVAACLWSVVPQPLLSTWLGIGLLTVLAQWQSQRLIGRTCSNEPLGDDSVDRRRWIVSSALVSGLFWGASSMVLFPASAVAHQLLLAFILVVITTLWLPLFALTQLALPAFAVPGLLPMAFALFTSPHPPKRPWAASYCC